MPKQHVKTACQYAMPIQHTVTLTVTVSATATVTLTVTVTVCVCVSVCLWRIQLHHLQHHHLLHHLWHHCPQHEFFLFCGRALVVLVLHILLHSLAPLSRLVLLCIFKFCRCHTCIATSICLRACASVRYAQLFSKTLIKLQAP